MTAGDTPPSIRRVEEDATERRRGMIVVGEGATALSVVRRVARMAPVTVVASSPVDLGGELHDVRVVVGDGTSRLVLQKAGVQQAVALVAATADDDVNEEACRLALAAEVPHVVCRLQDSSRREAVMAAGAQPVTADLAMAGALTARLPGIVVTTSEVGLGRGEILQVRVMPGSLVVGRALSTVATRAFLVAAIYRDGELVVPHGDTVVQAGDQVLLVGEPEALAAIADYFRIGGARFPRQFGHSVVLWDRGDSPAPGAEAAWLVAAARVTSFQRADEGNGASGRLSPAPEPLRIDREDPWRRIGEVDAGLWVLDPPSRRRFAPRNLGRLRALLRSTQSPVLLARGTFPYKRILVPMSESDTAWRGLELAVDIARQVDAEVTAVHVKMPGFLGGAIGEERAQRVVANVEQVAQLYGLHVHMRVEEGNPVRLAAALAQDSGLVVVAHRPDQADTYLSPDVGLRIALQAPCSSLLLPGNGRAAHRALENAEE